MSVALRGDLEAALGQIQTMQPLAAGHGADAFRLETPSSRFFVKVGRGHAAAQIRAEATGLHALLAHSPMVAQVRWTGDADGATALALDWVEQGRRTPRGEAQLGEGLAELHRYSAAEATRYGFAADNFIGATPQRNTSTGAWPAFFRDYRLMPQVALARQNGYWQTCWTPWLEQVYRRLDDLLPSHPPPSLLHGDLWSGNVLYRADGSPVLIDPAVYHGDREADLAMTRLFGGFGRAFYEAYEATWPPDGGAEERVGLYNLYHLLNHLNLFGSGYAGSVEGVLKKFRH
ncbi:MAG: fructosamine kinase family protein [Bacteroidota bacterium]